MMAGSESESSITEMMAGSESESSMTEMMAGSERVVCHREHGR
jgi:hypothetical protein